MFSSLQVSTWACSTLSFTVLHSYFFSLSGRSHLRSASRSDLFTLDFSTKSFGLRGFCVSGPRCWNSLPPHLRLPSLSPPRFRSLLKAHLFSCSFPVL